MSAPKVTESEKKGCVDKKGKEERREVRREGKADQHHAQLFYTIKLMFPLTMQ